VYSIQVYDFRSSLLLLFTPSLGPPGALLEADEGWSSHGVQLEDRSRPSRNSESRGPVQPGNTPRRCRTAQQGRLERLSRGLISRHGSTLPKSGLHQVHT